MVDSQYQTELADPQPAYRQHNLSFLTMMTGYFIVGIVLWHVRGAYWEQYYTWGASLFQLDIPGRLIEILLMYPIGGFVFVAGFRFNYSLLRYGNYTDENNRFQLRKYAMARLQRLIIPYLIWSAIYLCIGFGKGAAEAILKQQGLPSFITDAQLRGLLLGVDNLAFQLWFLPMLFFVSILVAYVRYVLNKPILLTILFFVNALMPVVFPDLDYFPVSYWISFLLNYEIGVYCAKLFYDKGKLPYPRLILYAWLTVMFAILVNSSGSIDYALTLAGANLTPLTLYILTYKMLQRPNLRQPGAFLQWLGNYSWPIFLLHAPFLTSWTISFMRMVGLYNYWTLFLITAFLVAVCIIIYQVVLRILPRVTRFIF